MEEGSKTVSDETTGAENKRRKHETELEERNDEIREEEGNGETRLTLRNHKRF